MTVGRVNNNAVALVDRTVAVIYIVHREYGIDPVARFVESYAARDAGFPHRLIIAFKAFDTALQKEPFKDLLGAVSYEGVDVPPNGYDIGTYLLLSRQISADHYAFFNTKSEILADSWLAKLMAAFVDPKVGIAGASGSVQSLAGYELRFRHGPPMPRWQSGLRMVVRYLLALRRFPAYPNPHLRTNAIVISEHVMGRVRDRVIRTKSDAGGFESGRRGLSRIVRRMGLRAVVVDRDGGVHNEVDWATSGTFWQEDQQSLMVADNRTHNYTEGDAAERVWLYSCAWRWP